MAHTGLRHGYTSLFLHAYHTETHMSQSSVDADFLSLMAQGTIWNGYFSHLTMNNALDGLRHSDDVNGRNILIKGFPYGFCIIETF